jgi:hypothetical protein
MKKEYRKPEIETIVLNNQPMLAGQSHPDADAKRGVSFGNRSYLICLNIDI